MVRFLLDVVSLHFVLHPYSKHGKYIFYVSMEMVIAHKYVVQNNLFSNLNSTKQNANMAIFVSF